MEAMVTLVESWFMLGNCWENHGLIMVDGWFTYEKMIKSPFIAGLLVLYASFNYGPWLIAIGKSWFNPGESWFSREQTTAILHG